MASVRETHLSPYLFILVANVLQQLCISSLAAETWNAPLQWTASSQCCSTQTILCCTSKETSNKQGLSRESSSCSHCTLGCKLISTRTPLCPFALISHIRRLLRCWPKESLQKPSFIYPKNYAWYANASQSQSVQILTWGGRLILINFVLAAIPNHFMECFLWPKESLQKLEQILQGFFGKERVLQVADIV